MIKSYKGLLSLVYIILFSLGCLTNRETDLKNYYETGELKSIKTMMENDTSFFYKGYYKSGEVKHEGTLSREDRRIGAWKYYDSDGSIIAKGNYADDLKTGEWIYDKYVLAWNIYIHPDSLYKLNFPSDWKVEENSRMDLISFFEDSSKEQIKNYFNVTVLKSNLELDEMTRKSIRDLEQIFDDFSILSQSNIEIDNKRAWFAKIQIKEDDSIVFARQVFLKLEDSFININFFTDKQDLKFYDEVMFSIRPFIN